MSVYVLSFAILRLFFQYCNLSCGKSPCLFTGQGHQVEGELYRVDNKTLLAVASSYSNDLYFSQSIPLLNLSNPSAPIVHALTYFLESSKSHRVTSNHNLHMYDAKNIFPLMDNERKNQMEENETKPHTKDGK